jgi:hypothetical protein
MGDLFSDRMAFRDKLLHPTAGPTEAIQVVDEWADTTGKVPAQTFQSGSAHPSARPPAPKKNERPRSMQTAAVTTRDPFGPPVRPENNTGLSPTPAREPVLELATVKLRAANHTSENDDDPLPLKTRSNGIERPMEFPRAPRMPHDLQPLATAPTTAPPVASADSSTPTGRSRVPGSHDALRISAIPQTAARRSQRSTVVAVVAGVVAILLVLAIIAPWRSRHVRSPQTPNSAPIERSEN